MLAPAGVASLASLPLLPAIKTPVKDEAFWNQPKEDIISSLGSQFGIKAKELKDIDWLLSMTPEAEAGLAYKKAVYQRAFQLLCAKENILNQYAASSKRNNKPYVRLYYLGEKENFRFQSFDPAQMVLAHEESLRFNTFNDMEDILYRIGKGSKVFFIDEGENVKIWLRRGVKRITATDGAELYTALLGATVSEPCLYRLDENGTLFLYRADGRRWLRVGTHEFSSQDNYHLHIHEKMLFPVKGGLHKGQEPLILNYRLPFARAAQRQLALTGGGNRGRVLHQTMTSKAVSIMEERGLAVKIK